MPISGLQKTAINFSSFLLNIDTPKITSVKALAPSPRFCDHVSPVPNVNFDWENYKQKQTPNKKQTEKPQTTITK